MGRTAATTAWRIRPEVVLALEDRFGEPTDSYVNGSQTWLFDHGPNDVTLEWRLHPVASYAGPRGLSPYELWETVVAALAAGADPDALALGQETRPLTSLWDGLECFAAHGDDVEPAVLAERATELLGIAPDGAGLVDHDRIGNAWEQARGRVSVVDLLFDQLGQPPAS